MTMRITITNDEPGFSDARVAIRQDNRKFVLTGEDSLQIVLRPNEENQITIQALRRAGETKS